MHKGIHVKINGKIFKSAEGYLTWPYLDNNIELEIEKYKDFIERVDDSVKKRGYYTNK